MTKPNMLLWLSDARGVYIPRDFANSFADRAGAVSGVDEDTWDILDTGPDHDDYWEAWDEVLQNAIITDEHGIKYSIWQEGDCWLIPLGMEWNEEHETYMWPQNEDA